MKKIWWTSDSIISPLGISSFENYNNIQSGKTGIGLVARKFLPNNLFAASLDAISNRLLHHDNFTKFESLCIQAVQDATRKISIDLNSPRVAFILSTTKGNIDLIGNYDSQPEKLSLSLTAKKIVSFFKTGPESNATQPYIISNACISGVLTVILAKRLLQSDQYDHTIIVGCDLLSEFVISGFQSLQAISDQPCKPFDKYRSGISLGEAAACLVLTTKPEEMNVTPSVMITGSGVTNDANHISGPSRTGMELAKAVTAALENAHKEATTIGFISAHGTATLYNDEMEAKAFNHIGLQDVPLNSLKGYFGHTLGAAGLVELIISYHSLQDDKLIPTMGYAESGVSQSLNVITKIENKRMNSCLKTASGFGGCNAALVMEKL